MLAGGYPAACNVSTTTMDLLVRLQLATDRIAAGTAGSAAAAASAAVAVGDDGDDDDKVDGAAGRVIALFGDGNGGGSAEPQPALPTGTELPHEHEHEHGHSQHRSATVYYMVVPAVAIAASPRGDTGITSSASGDLADEVCCVADLYLLAHICELSLCQFGAL